MSPAKRYHAEQVSGRLSNAAGIDQDIPGWAVLEGDHQVTEEMPEADALELADGWNGLGLPVSS